MREGGNPLPLAFQYLIFMFVIESSQKIEYNALFMKIFIPVSNFGDQPLGILHHKKAELRILLQQSVTFLFIRAGKIFLKTFSVHCVHREKFN